MTIETFFEKFDQFTDAPDAVEKMRQLVLQLAVLGQLVERRESDGRAAEIFSERLPPAAPSRFRVPGTWMWVRFAAVGDQRLGKMLDQKGNRGELKPYLRNTNVQWMRIELGDVKQLRLEPDELGQYRLLPGDLLICEGGEPGRCAIWRDESREMYFQKAIHRVRPRKGILSEYLAVCLQVDAKNGVLATHFTGATIKHFTGRSLSGYAIPLPPLAEQKRIVAKVDELMALCDRLEAQQRERETRHAELARAALGRFSDAPTPANLQLLFHPSYAISPAELRKTILTLAVRGKFVSDTKTRHVTLGEVIELVSGQHLLAHEQNEAEQGIPYLTGPSDFGARHPRATRWTETPKVVAEPGDILITVKGAGVGKTNKLIASPTAISRQLMAVRVTDAEPDFVHIVLMNAAGHFQESMTGIAIPGIGRRDVLELEAELPPLAEQKRIVAKVDELMVMVDQLEAQLAESRVVAANLFSAAVAELTTSQQSV